MQQKGAAQEPYVNHLLEVAELVAAAGGDQQAVIAALLHDAIEDQEISREMIPEQFSEQYPAPASPPPALGADTGDVLASLRSHRTRRRGGAAFGSMFYWRE
jgi:crotonobetainyl-CoA:carnitine CoA-transferase CaiB-like acyl-CoA transferase